MRWKPIIVLGQSEFVPRPFARNNFKSTLWILGCFFFLYFLTYKYCSYAFVRDPTSYFFDPAQGYKRQYSVDREKQALAFVEAANLTNSTFELQSKPSMCIGVATIARSDQQYVRSTIGSLLEGLSQTQRSQIHLSVLIAHTNPSVHPIYGEPWLKSVSNEVLNYHVDDNDLARLKLFEEEHLFRNKSMFDYAYLLSRCHDTGADWIAMVEDDVLARGGWYSRSITALEHIQSQISQADWLYLRMFYTENLFGWNGEEWNRYLLTSLALFVVLAGFLVCARIFSTALQRHLSKLNIMIICVVCFPACVILYFMAGRNSMQPLSPGVHEMSKYGCCSQGFIFPREIVPRVVERAKQAIFEDFYVDMLLERWADTESLVRYALVPSLLQHIGSKSSKGWGYDEGASSTWNFGFEAYT